MTPDSFVVDKGTQRIRSAEIADKTVQTTRRAEGARSAGAGGAAPGILALNRAGRRPDAARDPVEALYSHPWTSNGPSPTARSPSSRPAHHRPARAALCLDWTPPSPTGRYARGSVIEAAARAALDLFESMALPRGRTGRWTTSWARSVSKRFLRTLTTLVTINGFAYYDYSMTARETVGLLATFLFNPRALALSCGVPVRGGRTRRGRATTAGRGPPGRGRRVDGSAARLLVDAEGPSSMPRRTTT
ncbi:MAG: hypothetical protein IPL60_12135 [Ardenticatenia bacterium]|nr:hypothetical protein [Ardenticatenia bacterium]